MVPKYSGFNQSETASGVCEAFLSLRRHTFPSKVRLRKTKLQRKCGCNNNAIFFLRIELEHAGFSGGPQVSQLLIIIGPTNVYKSL